MKTCSYCGHGSEDNVAACSGCGTEFPAPDLSPEPVDPVLTDPGETLVVLACCRTVIEANMLKLRLDAAGIESCVPEELNPQIFWYAVPSPLEDVSVRVRARDFARARAVMQDPGDATPPPLPPSP